jgi:mRNA interferase MazF
MQMRRGDLVTVDATGDYGKPRPAVIVQTDAFPENHASVVVCQLTSDLVDAPDFRVTIEPKPENGLRLKSQVMADKPVTVRRERIGHGPARNCPGVCPGARGLAMLPVRATDSEIHARLSADRCGIFQHPATRSYNRTMARPAG